MEATVDPPPRGPDWMPITPKTGSLFHADSQSRTGTIRGRPVISRVLLPLVRNDHAQRVETTIRFANPMR